MDSYSVITRCEQRWLTAICSVTGGAAIVGTLGMLGGYIALADRNPATQCMGLLIFCLAIFIGYLMMENFSWVELEESTLRAKRFWTRHVYEHDISQITSIVPMHSGRAGIEGMLAEAMMTHFLGTTNRGFIINFETRPRFVMIRGDMRDVD